MHELKLSVKNLVLIIWGQKLITRIGWLPLFSQCSCTVGPTLYKRYFEFDARTCVTQLGLRQPPWLYVCIPVLGWNVGTKRPRNETTKERIVQGTKRPRNETSKICVLFLGTKRLGNEKSSHRFYTPTFFSSLGDYSCTG